ncbi:carbohydrate ABC transporter permease [candidate division TA06 bacterium]|uniref:Carbohydrate ABC transporter permease n=1 Tax=candidate division TA06 bacterium TaxID=2250710 RepID=A0A660S847_UNCT6|nr:MAG: carbohydrate ABC transporter permease [candidate division TA06 bacterium]
MNKIHFNLSKFVIYLLLILGAVIMIVPFYWMITTAVKTPAESIKFPPTLWPSHFVWSNFAKAWKEANFGRYILNTLFIAFTTLAGVLFSSILGAYAFAKLQFKGRNILFISMLGIMMIPMPVYIVPGYLVLMKLGWIDTFYALIIPWTVSVFNIFLLRQHFKSIPNELYEAAVLDGCNHWQFLWKILVPLSKPMLVTISIFSLIGSWNSFIWPLVVTNSDKIRPIQVGLAYFMQEQSTNYVLLSAASTISVIPLILLFFLAQKQIISSYAKSGIKG